MLYRDVEAHDYQGTGFNILPLLCALGCYGCVFAGLFVARPPKSAGPQSSSQTNADPQQ